MRESCCASLASPTGLHIYSGAIRQSTKVYDTEKLADIFRQYYISLYNLPHPHSSKEKSSKKKVIQEYISRSGLPHIADEDLADLDKPLSADEVTAAIAQSAGLGRLLSPLL